MNEFTRFPKVSLNLFASSFKDTLLNKFLPNKMIIIDDSDDYGIFLEFGTIKMSSRPHFRSAFYKYAPKIEERIRRRLEK